MPDSFEHVLTLAQIMTLTQVLSLTRALTLTRVVTLTRHPNPPAATLLPCNGGADQ